jgi:hypothetical protein
MDIILNRLRAMLDEDPYAERRTQATIDPQRVGYLNMAKGRREGILEVMALFGADSKREAQAWHDRQHRKACAGCFACAPVAKHLHEVGA